MTAPTSTKARRRGKAQPSPPDTIPSLTTFKLKDVRANPFRNIDRYPIQPDKIEALRASIQTTGFWSNVVARVVDGYAEITYGHHRLAALREEYGEDHQINLIIRDLDDEDMLRMMADENRPEWEHDTAEQLAMVRAVIDAYADGRIKLPKPPKRTKSQVIRYAPSCIAGASSPPAGDHPAYTSETVAKFLGWRKKHPRTGFRASERITRSLDALELIDRGILSEHDFEGLKTTEAQAVVREAQKAEGRHRGKPDAEHVAGLVGSGVAEAIRFEGASSNQADRIARTIDPAEPTIPDVNILAEKLGRKFANLFNPSTDKLTEQLEEVIEFKKYLDPTVEEDLGQTLILACCRLQDYLRRFGGKQRTRDSSPKPRKEKPPAVIDVVPDEVSVTDASKIIEAQPE